MMSSLMAHADLFTAVDLKRRVFHKVLQASLRERRIRSAAFEASPEAQLVVDVAGHLVVANDRARRLFSLTSQDAGRMFQDLELSYRPLELRSKIQPAYVERRPSNLHETEWRDPAGDQVSLEVQVIPLVDERQGLLGASVTFTDVTRSRHFQQELEHANRDLEDAYAELQSTNEERETTNEELQSSPLLGSDQRIRGVIVLVDDGVRGSDGQRIR